MEVRRAGDSKIVAAAYHTAPFADKDYAALDALIEVLTADPSGYLYKSLVETQKVSSLWAFSPTVRDAGLMYFHFDVPKDKDLENTRNVVRTELDKIASIPYHEQDLARAKAKLLKQIENLKNNTINKAISYTEFIGAGGYKLGFLYRDNVENLSLADLNKVAQKYFKSNNRTVGIFNPSKDEQRVKPAEFTTTQIAALTDSYKGKALEKEAAPFEASIANLKKNLKEGALTNGMKYGLVNKELKGDKILASFKLLMGNESELAGKSSVSSLTAALLKAGTKTKTKEQIQDRLDQLNSTIGFRTSGQAFTINLSTYKNSFAETMDILQDILANANFPQNEITKMIAENNTYLEGQQKDPQAIAMNELQRLANPYPKESIFYTPTLQEEIDNNKKVTREQLVAFHQNIMGASNGFGTVLGSIDEKLATSSLEKTFGKFSAKSKYAEVKPTYFETKKIDKNFVTPDRENAVAFGTGKFRMDQKSPDYAAFLLANEILGSGGFLSARLPMRLREKEGISYGVGSYLIVPVSDDVASWNYYAFLNPTKRDAVEAAWKEEVANALKTGFTAEELASNKKSYANVQQTDLGTDNMLISLVNKKLQYGVSLDEYDALNSKVQALKLDEVNGALKKYLTLDKITSVYAGDFNKK